MKIFLSSPGKNQTWGLFFPPVKDAISGQAFLTDHRSHEFHADTGKTAIQQFFKILLSAGSGFGKTWGTARAASILGHMRMWQPAWNTWTKTAYLPGKKAGPQVRSFLRTTEKNFHRENFSNSPTRGNKTDLSLVFRQDGTWDICTRIVDGQAGHRLNLQNQTPR